MICLGDVPGCKWSYFLFLLHLLLSYEKCCNIHWNHFVQYKGHVITEGLKTFTQVIMDQLVPV